VSPVASGMGTGIRGDVSNCKTNPIHRGDGCTVSSRAASAVSSVTSRASGGETETATPARLEALQFVEGLEQLPAQMTLVPGD